MENVSSRSEMRLDLERLDFQLDVIKRCQDDLCSCIESLESMQYKGICCEHSNLKTAEILLCDQSILFSREIVSLQTSLVKLHSEYVKKYGEY